MVHFLASVSKGYRQFRDLLTKQLHLTRFMHASHYSCHRGCVFAFHCDSRIARTGEYKIGITAARIGIAAPAWVHQLFAQLVELCFKACLSLPLMFTEKVWLMISEGSNSFSELIENAMILSHKYTCVSQEARTEMNQ